MQSRSQRSTMDPSDVSTGFGLRVSRAGLEPSSPIPQTFSKGAPPAFLRDLKYGEFVLQVVSYFMGL